MEQQAVNNHQHIQQLLLQQAKYEPQGITYRQGITTQSAKNIQNNLSNINVLSPAPIQVASLNTQYMNQIIQSNRSVTNIIPTTLTTSIQPIQNVQYKSVNNLNNAEVHNIERQLQVVTMDDMESKLKIKCAQLEIQLYEMQLELNRYKLNSGQPLIQYVQDDSKILEFQKINKDLTGELANLKLQNKSLNDELDQWKIRYKQLQESNAKNSGQDEELRRLKLQINSLQNDLKNSNDQNTFKDQEILKLKQLLNNKDNELDELDSQIREMQMQLESYSTSEQQILTLSGEVELWKKKFKQINEQNSDLAERLTMAETSLEALRKSKITVTKETEVKTSTRGSVIGGSATRNSGYMKQL